MSAFDIAIIILVSVAFVAVVAGVIYKKVKGKGGCDCGCDGCPHCTACHSAKPDRKKK
jgi:hypothetical protein